MHHEPHADAAAGARATLTRTRLVRAVAVLLVAGGVVLAVTLRHPGTRPAAGPAAPVSAGIASSVAAATGAPSAGGAGTSLQAPAPPLPVPGEPGRPVLVSVPRLGISSSLQSLGLLADHSLQAPTEYQRAGWYAAGVRPGQVGPAIIAGHVDSYQGPAIFFRLREIARGDDVVVQDAAGVRRHFTVTAIAQYPKARFPTEAVYGPSALPVLRLITCTGAFDAADRSYLDNLVVTAELAAPRAG